MKQSIILKTLFIIGGSIILIFLSSGYLFFQKDKELIDDIRKYNLSLAIKALDERQESRLSFNKKLMEDTASMIAKNSSEYLLNFDTDGLKKSLIFDIKKDGIMAIQVWDDGLNESFLLAIKNNKKVVFPKSIPNKFKDFEKFVHPIYEINVGDKEKIGQVILYYDKSIIINQINKLKEKTKQEIEQFNHTIDKKLSASIRNKYLINIISLFAILLMITFLLRKLVNKPLKQLQSGLDEFFMFLQNKKDTAKRINIDSKDEFGQMAQSLNENIIVSAKLHEEIHELNINLEQRIEEKTKKVTTLLNNAGQGFLTFNKDFIIDDEYSKECEKLLGDNISNQDIALLLFKDIKKAQSFKIDIKDTIETKNPVAQRSLISLLPNEIILNRRALKIEYKILEDYNVMLVITNISAQKKLEKKIKKEQNILQMIVTIMSDSDIFYDTKKDFEDFIKYLKRHVDSTKTSLHNINELYRTIHTFKGAFLQLFMNNTAHHLHNVETELSKYLVNSIDISNEELVEFLININFKSFIENDLTNINELLGQKFLNNDNVVYIDKQIIKNIEKQYINLLEQSNIHNETAHCLLDDIRYLSQKSLKSQLKSYPRLTLQIAQKLEKEIYEFEIIGDENILVSDTFKPFIRSLIHLFRNSIDHGIEIPEKRYELGKDEIGTIACSFNQQNDMLQIIISDDGAGINIEKIKAKLDSSIDTSKLTNEDIYKYIFKDNLSTKDEVTDTSGRGVGMSAVKAELDKLNGTIKIQSELNIGTTFIFTLPI